MWFIQADCTASKYLSYAHAFRNNMIQKSSSIITVFLLSESHVFKSGTLSPLSTGAVFSRSWLCLCKTVAKWKILFRICILNFPWMPLKASGKRLCHHFHLNFSFIELAVVAPDVLPFLFARRVWWRDILLYGNGNDFINMAEIPRSALVCLLSPLYGWYCSD